MRQLLGLSSAQSHALKGNVTEVRRIASAEDFEDVKSPGLEEK
jgi:hypothetical protein